ncbi:MAG: efflux RND transporter periplasmic adaptor subunit [Candidatus Delongbacteria bacterium]|nr:efflux RND transporter periplasmic adaptor subunit [Candidatus Delongbacteria bacterium]
MKKIITTITMILILALSSCSKEDPAADKKQKKEVSPSTVKIELVQEKDLQLYASVTGRLEGITDITYFSEVSGKVKSIEKRLGDPVKKGEAIAFLDAKNYKINYDRTKSDLMSAEASLDVAKIKLETTEKLYNKDKASKVEFANDKSGLKRAEAAYAGSKANLETAKLNYENSKFLSPVNGSISKLNIKEGQFVGMGQPVATIVDCRKLLIKTGVSERDILSIKKGNLVDIKYNGSGTKFTGVLLGIGKRPDESGTYPVEIELKNEERSLLPGMIVEAKIYSTKLENKIYTDFDNLIEEYGKYFVYVVNNENIATRRKVEFSMKYGNKVVIDSGLKVGEKIVVAGMENLSNGVKVKIFKR